MTELAPEADTLALTPAVTGPVATPEATPSRATRQRKAANPSRCMPLLERLASLYPALFGANFLPLKRGIYQDLMAAHPEELDGALLKEALALHTRSTRYLAAVASGQQRHDLSAAAVEAMAPEHVHHSLLEVFRRRQSRSDEDLRPQLRERMVRAFEASGLSREDYALRVRSRDEAANALLEEALAEAAARAAKVEALLRAYESSGQSVQVFADMYGMNLRDAQRSLTQAARRREMTAVASSGTPAAAN